MTHKVLIIDDNLEFVETASALLQKHSYKVDSAPNGKMGLAKAGELHPDLILLAVGTDSNSDDFEVARELNKDDNLKNIPVIIVTDIKKKMSLPFGFEPDDAWLPVKGVLEKPVKPDVLLKSVALCIADGRKAKK